MMFRSVSICVLRRISIGLLCTCLIAVLLTHNSPRKRPKMTDMLNERHKTHELIVVCASNMDSQAFRRWAASAAIWGAHGHPLGRNRQWKGFGTKLVLLLEKLKELINAGRTEDIVLYTDSFDVLFVGPLHDVVTRFLALKDTRILFGAQKECWPDRNMTNLYPKVKIGYRFLNAGVIIGYVSTLYELMTLKVVREEEDDQRFFTSVYLNSTLRDSLHIRLDHKAEIFQCMIYDYDYVHIVPEAGSWPHLENRWTGTKPLVLHGYGVGREVLWSLGKSLVRAWVKARNYAPDAVPRISLEMELLALGEWFGLTRDGEEAGSQGMESFFK